MSEPTPETTTERLLRRACADLEQRLRAGETVSAETVFAAHPILFETEATAIEVIYGEYVTREALGQPPDRDDLIKRFPRWTQALRDQFHVHDALRASGFSETAPALPASVARLGPYALIARVAQGGRGIVYRARHEKLGHDVALKLLNITTDAPRLALEEASAMARLAHPNVVHLYETGVTPEGRPYLVLEWIEGETLAARLDRDPMAQHDAAALVETLARAIHHCHQRNILHGDLTPRNILIDDQQRPRLTDFGFSRSTHAPQEKAIRGTPAYAAPEQLRPDHPVGPATDVYGLGAILYELLSGRPPFLADSPLETVNLVLNREVDPPTRPGVRVSRDLSTIALRCLEKDPARRYADAEALAQDLHRFSCGEPIHARPIGLPERAVKWARRHPARALTGAMLFLIPVSVLVTGMWYVGQLREATTEAQLQRAHAEQQTRLVEDQLEAARRSAYALQLAQVDTLWQRDPDRALTLLNDPARCPIELREFTWRLFESLCHGERRVIQDQPATVFGAAYARDGRSVITGGRDGIVKRWDAATGKLLAQYTGLNHLIHSVCFSRTGQYVAAVGDGGALFIWDASQKTLLGSWHAHQDIARHVAADPSSDQLATVGHDGLIRFWALDPLGPAQSIDSGLKRASAICYAPDGSRLALCGDSTLQLYDVHSGSRLWEVFIEQTNVRMVTFSPDGRHLAVAANALGALVFDANTGMRQTTVRVPNHRTTALAFSADNTTLFTAGSDKTLRRWHLPEGTPGRAAAAHSDDVWHMALSPDGRELVTAGGDGTVRFWNLDPSAANPMALEQHARSMFAIAVSPDGQSVVAGGSGNLRVSSLDGLRHAEIASSSRTHRLAFLQQGKTLLAIASDRVRAWSWPDGAEVENLHPKQAVTALAAQPNSEVAYLHGPQLALQWRGKAQPVGAPDGPIRASALSPDGALVFGGADGKLHVGPGDQGPWRTIETISDRPIECIAFSPDGKLCATGSVDSTLVLWEVKTWTPRSLLRGHSHAIWSVMFSPDGRTLASGTGSMGDDLLPGEVKLWDVATGLSLATLPGMKGPVAFTPDGDSLLTNSEADTLWRWRAVTTSPTTDPNLSGAGAVD